MLGITVYELERRLGYRWQPSIDCCTNRPEEVFAGEAVGS